MSRRDFPTQLWQIENDVARGDVAGALLHYDRALRTTPSAWPTLFPVLAGAADQQPVQAPLLRLLAQAPPWRRPFLERFVPSSRSPVMLFALARTLGLATAQSPDSAMLQTIEKRLTELAAFDDAAALYDRAHPFANASDGRIQNGDFERPGGFDPFDWNLVDEPDLAADRRPSPAPEGGTALFLTAANGRGGEVAEQLLILHPGDHLIGAKVGSVHGDRQAAPRLTLQCVSSGRSLLDQPFPPAPANGVGWQVPFSVPPGCKAERLAVDARSPLVAGDDVPWIDHIVVRTAAPH